MITLGIPGDAATAVLMGALTIHNLQPGPMLFQDHPEIVHQIFAGMISANIVFVILGLIFARFFAQVINIDRKFLVPLIFIACMVGSYAINNVLYDLVDLRHLRLPRLPHDPLRFPGGAHGAGPDPGQHDGVELSAAPWPCPRGTS